MLAVSEAPRGLGIAYLSSLFVRSEAITGTIRWDFLGTPPGVRKCKYRCRSALEENLSLQFCSFAVSHIGEANSHQPAAQTVGTPYKTCIWSIAPAGSNSVHNSTRRWGNRDARTILIINVVYGALTFSRLGDLLPTPRSKPLPDRRSVGGIRVSAA